jgi:lipoprotein-releasing system permease protein
VAGLTLSIALRFLGARENRFARFVTWVSFIGLTLGVMILTVVATVMNGFDNELRSRLLQAIPHVTVTGIDAQHPFASAASARDVTRSAHDYFQGIGAITNRGAVRPIRIYGTSPQGFSAMEFVGQHLDGVSFDDLRRQQAGILIGAPLARILRLAPGDALSVVVSTVSGDLVVPKPLRFNLVGTFELGAEPDYDLAIVSLDDRSISQWQELGELGLQVQLSEPLRAQALTRELGAQFPELNVTSWSETYGELFQAVQLEKSMMFTLLLLVVAIAAFNIIAGQVMTVSDKSPDIAILRTMGAPEALIRNVFLAQGALISLLGTAIGIALGLLVALNINALLDGLQALTGMHLLDGSFFVEVPILILPSDLLLIAALSGLLCLVSAWIPARRATQVNPVVALHR